MNAEDLLDLAPAESPADSPTVPDAPDAEDEMELHLPELGGWWPPEGRMTSAFILGAAGRRQRNAVITLRASPHPPPETALVAVCSLAAVVDALGAVPLEAGYTRRQNAIVNDWLRQASGGFEAVKEAAKLPELRPYINRLFDDLGNIDRMATRAKAMRRSLPAIDHSLLSLDGDSPPWLSELPSLPAGGWTIRAGQLLKVSEDGERETTVAHGVPWLTSICEGAGTCKVELSWRDLHTARWRRRWFDKSDLYGSKALEKLASAGVPAFTDRSDLMRWLRDYEAENAGDGVITRRALADTLGWCDVDGQRALVTGERAYLNGSECDTTAPEAPVIVQPGDGRTTIIDGWGKTAGTLDGWRSTVAPWLERWPVVGAAYVTSLAAPVVSRLGVSSTLLVELAAPSGTGKTTAQRVAASVWGPSEVGCGPLASWCGTAVGLERRAGALGHLPLILNETGTRHGQAGGRAADHQRRTAEAIYMLSENAGRTRGTPTGLQRVERWSTTVLISGERPILANTPGVGTRARVLTIEREPLGSHTHEMQREARRLERALTRHHGHAAGVWGQWLSALTDEQWSEWSDRLHAEADRLGDAHDAGPGGRLAMSAAILLTTRDMAEAAGLPVPERAGLLELIHGAAKTATAEADRALAAGLTLMSELGRRERAVMRMDNTINGIERPSPVTGWEARDLENGLFAVVKDPASLFLSRRGFDVPAVSREWMRRGWLKPAAPSRAARGCLTRQERYGGPRRVASWVFTAEAAALLGMEPGPFAPYHQPEPEPEAPAAPEPPEAPAAIAERPRRPGVQQPLKIHPVSSPDPLTEHAPGDPFCEIDTVWGPSQADP